MEWPGGRVLLQWAIDEARLHLPLEPASSPAGSGTGVPGGNRMSSGVIMEMGAGIGTTSIGIAVAAASLAATQAAAIGSAPLPSPAGDPQVGGAMSDSNLVVVATDVCEEALRNLRSNVSAHGRAVVERGRGLVELRAEPWDACRGEESVDALPVPIGSLRCLIGSDVVYHGFDPWPGKSNTAAPGPRGSPADHHRGLGLEATLAALLKRRPDLPVVLLLEDRFSGGVASAVAGVAGLVVKPSTTDPAIESFCKRCAQVGLDVERVPLPKEVVRSVQSSQDLLTKARWWFFGTWDGGLALYRITLASNGNNTA